MHDPAALHGQVSCRRLSAADVEQARSMFTMMTQVFEERDADIDDAWCARLLADPSFWALAAVHDDAVVGGITAHRLPMTRSMTTELFIYDVAVQEAWQRRGVGRRMMAELRELAAAEGVHVLFVPAAVEDDHAVEFYRAAGGEEEDVRIFTFTAPG